MIDIIKDKRGALMGCLLALMCLLSMGASPDGEKLVIAVIDLETSPNLSKAVGIEISDKIRTHLGHLNRFDVIDRNRMKDLLNRQDFLRPNGCNKVECHPSLFDSQGTMKFLEKCGASDQEAAIEIGFILGADKILIGLVNKLDGRHTISIRIIDVASSAVEVTDQVSYQQEVNDLDQKIEELVARLQEKIPSDDDAYHGRGAAMQEKGTKRLNLQGYGEIKDMQDLMSAMQERIKERDENRGGGMREAGDNKPTKEIGARLTELSEMRLIPAGAFLMGSDGGEGPVHEVFVNAFYIDTYEVTNAQYLIFLDATGHRPPPSWGKTGFDGPDQPVMGVSWESAIAYAKWAGKRLPTEAEWERAARGGEDARIYPWGNEWKEGYCQSAGGVTPLAPAPVGSHPEGVSPFGCLDMAGNVWEWCNDWYSPDYYAQSERQNPQGPSEGSWHVVRGGGWESPPSEVRTTARRGGCPDGGYICAGFRCAKDAR